jgi:hypothetical protein
MAHDRHKCIVLELTQMAFASAELACALLAPAAGRQCGGRAGAQLAQQRATCKSLAASAQPHNHARAGARAAGLPRRLQRSTCPLRTRLVASSVRTICSDVACMRPQQLIHILYCH